MTHTQDASTPRRLSRRQFLKISLFTALATTGAGMSGATYAIEIEPGNLDIRPVELTLPRLDPTFDGYRLVQFSDIHMGSWMTQKRLQHVIDLVNEQAADFIAITGDFVTQGDIQQQAAELVPALRRLQSRDGIAAVLGNHDHWTEPDAIRGVIADSSITDLNNRTLTLRRADAELHIAGVDDYWERQSDLHPVLSNLPDTGAAVLLAHEPDYADISAQTGRFDLQISGHSHGGQVILPFIGPPVLPAYGRKYPVGLYQVGEMIQYTNRGVGMIAPAMRFNCRPEITVFTLRAARA